jgi:hypothetical protein
MKRVLFSVMAVWLTVHTAGCKENTVNPYGSFDWQSVDGRIPSDGYTADAVGGDTQADGLSEDSKRGVPDGSRPPDVVVDATPDQFTDADLTDLAEDLSRVDDLSIDTGDTGEFQPFSECDAQTPLPLPAAAPLSPAARLGQRGMRQ